MGDSFDVVVIASGAGGAPIANRLARQGKSVIFDKGPLLRPNYRVPGKRNDNRRDGLYSSGAGKILRIAGLANTGVSYYSIHVEPDINDEPRVYRGKGDKDYGAIEGYAVDNRTVAPDCAMHPILPLRLEVAWVDESGRRWDSQGGAN